MSLVDSCLIDNHKASSYSNVPLKKSTNEIVILKFQSGKTTTGIISDKMDSLNNTII